MAKAIRWQVPFCTNDLINPTHYRVDIYDEGYTGIPVQLYAGEQPFVTSEGNSEDFFAPIRTQTGTLQVCTSLPNGGRISLDELLPANNIARPLQLLNITDPSNPIIEWQGFLSCEAYSQNYTAIPENLSLPVISVLEAMASMFINKYTLKPLGTISSMLARVLNMMLQNSADINNVYFPKRGFDILSKIINTSAFLSKEEYQNEEQVVYKLSGINSKDIFQMICTYMGWTVREYKNDLYFQEPDGNGDMYMTAAGALIYYDGEVPSEFYEEVSTDEIDMATDLDWRNTDHKFDIRQGAHSVKVEAKMEKFNVDTKVPELPFGDLYPDATTYMQPWYVYMLASGDVSAYSNISYNFFKASIQIASNGTITLGAKSASNVENVITKSIPYAGASSPACLAYAYPANSYVTHAGAFLARMQFDDSTPDNQHQNTQDGLYVSLFGPVWQEHTTYTPVFQMKGVQVFAAYESGYIDLKVQVKKFLNLPGIGIDNSKIQVSLKIGAYNWTGTEWSNSNMTPFFIEFDNDGNIVGNWNDQMGIDEVDGILMPVDGNIMGEIVFSIYAETKGASGLRLETFGVFFSQLEVSYIPRKDVKRTERSNNTYYKELATNFRDDISISPSIASWLHNSPSPSILFDNNGTPLQLLAYTNGSIRPEVDLLNRLEAYYGASRQTLDLIVKHPTAAPLPLLKLNGINDGKKYLPLSESRDWRTDECTLTCFEIPQE